MAAQGGVSRVSSGLVPGTSGQRTIDGTAQSRAAVSTNTSQGAGRREVPDSRSRQLINFEGKVLNRAAPRGTYLNIIV
jgi:hypothetical protein